MDLNKNYNTLVRILFSKTEVLDLAVQSLVLKPGSFSRTVSKEILSLEYTNFPLEESEASLRVFLREWLF